MALTAGFDEHDHLVMGVVRDVPSINQDHLVALVKARHTQVGLMRKRERGQRTKEEKEDRQRKDKWRHNEIKEWEF